MLRTVARTPGELLEHAVRLCVLSQGVEHVNVSELIAWVLRAYEDVCVLNDLIGGGELAIQLERGRHVGGKSCLADLLQRGEMFLKCGDRLCPIACHVPVVVRLDHPTLPRIE